MPRWDLLLTDVHLATMAEGAAAYGIVEDGAIAISGGNIAWLGAQSELPASESRETRSPAIAQSSLSNDYGAIHTKTLRALAAASCPQSTRHAPQAMTNCAALPLPGLIP